MAAKKNKPTGSVSAPKTSGQARSGGAQSSTVPVDSVPTGPGRTGGENPSEAPTSKKPQSSGRASVPRKEIPHGLFDGDGKQVQTLDTDMAAIYRAKIRRAAEMTRKGPLAHFTVKPLGGRSGE